LGATLAQFFTSIRLYRKRLYYDDDGDDEGDSDDDSSPFDDAEIKHPTFTLPKDVDSMTFRSAEWMRLTLFDSSRGSIGLAWSIFKLRGTPNSDNWPVSASDCFFK